MQVINIRTNSIYSIIYVLTITNMVMLRNFDVVSDKFNVVEISLNGGGIGGGTTSAILFDLFLRLNSLC